MCIGPVFLAQPLLDRRSQRQADPQADRDLKRRDEIQKVALEWPAYGSRRITAELGRGKWTVNRKRVGTRWDS